MHRFRNERAFLLCLFAILLAGLVFTGCESEVNKLLGIDERDLICDYSGTWTMNNSWGVNGATVEFRNDSTVYVNGEYKGTWFVDDEVRPLGLLKWTTTPFQGANTFYEGAAESSCQALSGNMRYQSSVGTWNATKNTD